MYDLGGGLDGVRVPPGTNLLLVGPPLTGKQALAYEVLAHGAAEGQGSLLVTNTHRAARARADLGPLLPEDAPLGMVDCVTKHQGGQPVEGNVHYVSSPEDMTGVGIGVSEFLDRFDGGSRTAFCSLTTLLLYSNLQTVFRFLHVFTTRVENADGLGVHVLHEGVHDEKTMNTLNQLYDGIVHTREEGSPTTTLPPGAETP